MRIRQKILKELWQVLKLEEDVAPGSGVERNTQWTGATKTLLKGNASNAAVVSDMDAKRYDSPGLAQGIIFYSTI